MNPRTRSAGLALASLMVALAMPVRAAAATIGILVFDGFLTSDVTAPFEVFGAASKKAAFSSYKVAFELLARLSSQKFAGEVADSIQFGRLRGAFQ